MKGTSNEGNLTRHYIEIFDTGIVAINQFILTKEESLIGFDPIVTRFGKTLHRSIIAFKYGTIAGIFSKLSSVLVENNVKESDIL